MISILLTILKILGIVLLVLLGILLLLILLVLFVPVRYRADAHRYLTEEAEAPVYASVKATWLLHLISVLFSYPDAAYVNVKVLGITVFRSDQEKKKSSDQQADEEKSKITEKALDVEKEIGSENTWDEIESERKNSGQAEKTDNAKTESASAEGKTNKATTSDTTESVSEADKAETADEKEKKPTLTEFFKKLWDKIKNIKYTIKEIYDKIKHIVKNIRYYLKVLQSDTFKNAFSLCSGQVFSLLKSIAPKKVKGKLLVGTGDPASTGQVMAIYGILYPLLGDNISLTPDFEQQIVEGEILIKGRITLFKALKTAMIIFFNRDLRRLIKLLKREAA